MHRFDAYSLGATLYMPVLHPKVANILNGCVPAPASSIVLCLEDALAERDVPDGLSRLVRLISDLPNRLPVRAFLRPRDMNMGRDLCARAAGTAIEGIVAPKVMPETLPDWLEMTRDANLSVMPTLESASFFDPGRICAIRDILDDHPNDASRIAAIRLGGNDLLSALALRRARGVTSWEGPLGWILSMASSILISAGYPVAAPVYDVIDDLETLRREVDRDVAAGFISKTVIHPAQTPVINEAFRVSSEDIEQARAALDSQARAVFQFGGVMCEPATHRAWAERTMAREEIFGVSEEESPRESKIAFG
ncbi:HpcH/HpaI aldolase/citrate lyase family protein [Halomonas sp. 11-S5]|uniref:HpcH/HpaI aldolase/citrate lyase family protein n=1 Tax=Halomonas sp. 11-S5 TaxID=2994064 RepID=UPI0024699862|nr:HpcH/HpaI aldolase/citrate lyase family protein [Halomonas sp. 11-S5]